MNAIPVQFKSKPIKEYFYTTLICFWTFTVFSGYVCLITILIQRDFEQILGSTEMIT